MSDGLLRHGIRLEVATLAWNVVGVVVVAVAAIAARSVALAAFGFDSLVEIGASTVVVWELTGTDQGRTERALRWIRWAFLLLVPYVLAIAAVGFASGSHPTRSAAGVVWTAATAAVMAALAVGKHRTGSALGNPVLVTEGRVTAIDALLAGSVLLGLVLNALVGWWWADPLASLVVVGYALREARALRT